MPSSPALLPYVTSSQVLGFRSPLGLSMPLTPIFSMPVLGPQLLLSCAIVLIGRAQSGASLSRAGEYRNVKAKPPVRGQKVLIFGFNWYIRAETKWHWPHIACCRKAVLFHAPTYTSEILSVLDSFWVRLNFLPLVRGRTGTYLCLRWCFLLVYPLYVELFSGSILVDLL